ncbi:MAG: nucleotidyltransferase family protein [Mucilaginibacter sp.]|uniref:nucleotidyltransferase family protein n=1 Tax=Mucilaginibacter sp. TaxID=1882438 RepID=UPI0031A48056
MISLIILAAGESSRLGQPKQNLLFQGKTLLWRAIEAGQKSACNNIIVVLGANSNQIALPPGITTLYNQNWKDGMASSITRGMLEIINDPSIDKVIITLCDQPFVSANLLDALIVKHSKTAKPIVACAYDNITGVPALFDRQLFTELLQLQGDEGAKQILKNHTNDIAAIPFEQGSIDIDTPTDYAQLLGLSN